MVVNLPKVSIIIVCFNRHTYVRTAVDSVLAQDYPREFYEIIVVKNFRDEVIDEYLMKNNVSNYILGDHILGFNLAAGIKQSKGSIICFLEDDDLWERRKLRSVIERFERDDTLGFYKNNISMINSEGKLMSNDTYLGERIRKINELRTVYIDNSKKDNYQAYVSKLYPWHNVSSISLRRELIEPFLDYLERVMAADWFFFIASLASKWSLLIDSENLTYYRIHKENASIPVNVDEAAARAKLYSVYARLLDDNQVLSDLVNSSDRKALKKEIEASNLIMMLHLQFCDSHTDRLKMISLLLRLGGLRRTIAFQTSHRVIRGALAYIIAPKFSQRTYLRVMTSS
jgi:glycosyltransferase involved in cell wall biosynthesis